MSEIKCSKYILEYLTHILPDTCPLGNLHNPPVNWRNSDSLAY